jgi:hypothetical protein
LIAEDRALFVIEKLVAKGMLVTWVEENVAWVDAGKRVGSFILVRVSGVVEFPSRSLEIELNENTDLGALVDSARLYLAGEQVGRECLCSDS